MKHRSIALAVVIGVAIRLSATGIAQSAKIDITGAWVFTVETSAGSGTPTITL